MRKKSLASCGIAMLFAALELNSFGGRAVTAPGQQQTTETIVIVRHGEKPTKGLGQLTCRGLNRALALPGILIPKFGRPDYIFAPDPSVQPRDGNSPLYSYVRPLTTIEPTAIELGMPVNTQIGFDQIQQLQAELSRPIYADALVFVAWEHGYQDRFAKSLLEAYGENSSIVPPWRDNDYDMIFIIRLKRAPGRTSATFMIDHEGLNDKISNKCP